MSSTRLADVHPRLRLRGSGRFAASGALLALVWVLLTQWPAAWVASLVQMFSGGRVLLLDSRGTLWQGSAHLALTADKHASTASAWSQRLHWQIDVTGLSSVKIRWRTPDQAGAPEWVWQLSWQPSGLELRLSDVDWRLPTAWLAGWGTPWNTVQPEGVLRIESRQWRWQQNGPKWRMDGQFTLNFLGLATRLSSLHPLGDYRMQVLGGDSPQISLETLSGPLRMAGQGQWQQGRLVFEGEAWAEQASDEIALSNLLSVLGTRKGPRAILKVG